MGERLLCKQEVIGSIPFTSTLLRADALRSASPPNAKQGALRSAEREGGLQNQTRAHRKCAAAWFFEPRLFRSLTIRRSKAHQLRTMSAGLVPGCDCIFFRALSI